MKRSDAEDILDSGLSGRFIINKETGGSAFPIPGSEHNMPIAGMTLRDHFAGLALQSIPLSLDRNEQLMMARAAYSQADFMLRARGE